VSAVISVRVKREIEEELEREGVNINSTKRVFRGSVHQGEGQGAR